MPGTGSITRATTGWYWLRATSLSRRLDTRRHRRHGPSSTGSGTRCRQDRPGSVPSGTPGQRDGVLERIGAGLGFFAHIRLVIRGSRMPSQVTAAFTCGPPCLKAALETGDHIPGGFLMFRRVPRPCPGHPRRIAPSAKQFQSETLLREALSGNRLVFTFMDQHALLDAIALRVVAFVNIQVLVHPRR